MLYSNYFLIYNLLIEDFKMDKLNSNEVLWILQDGFYEEDGYVRFCDAMDRISSDYIFIDVLDGKFKITKSSVDIKEDQFYSINRPVIVIGGYTMARISNKYNWKPGTFNNDNFNYQVWIEKYGKLNMLNGDAIFCKIKDAPEHYNTNIFVRPLHDNKAFSGKVFSIEEFINFKNKIISGEIRYQTLNEETEIIISKPTKIYHENRFYVVDSKIVTHSLYKRAGVIYYDRNVDPVIKEFANDMINIWKPSSSFVIDIADTEYGLKIVELNNINSAGLYDADVYSIIGSFEEAYRLN